MSFWRNLILTLTFGCCFSLVAAAGNGEQEHQLVRRLAVFPIDSNGNYTKLADDVWWKVRERLTRDKRLLVAARSFLKAQSVLQPRRDLKTVDAVLLGQLLDAQALVTMYSDSEKLFMSVYETTHGRLLWSSHLSFHPSVPEPKQFPEMALKLTEAFLAEIPYQGYVVVDSLIGKPVYEREGRLLVQTKIALDTEIVEGDKVQLLRIKASRIAPWFQGGADFEIYAEGRVKTVESDQMVFELERITNMELVKNESLVRLPREEQRLRELVKSRQRLELTPPQLISEVERKKDLEKKELPLLASIGGLLNFAMFLLLAF